MNSISAGPSIRELSDGLIQRRATCEDAERLAAFAGDVFRHPGTGLPDPREAAWARDMASGGHPTFRPDDFTLVEERASGRIVSVMCLISQTWTYAGIPFSVGMPECVATHPDYRRRGLVRTQFDLVHQWSAERGELVQAIAGIPIFYRQFGYEMALELGAGRAGYLGQVPKLPEGDPEPYVARPARLDDLPFLAELDAQGCRRSLVACVRDAPLWRYELCGRSELNFDRLSLCVIESSAGESVGMLALHTRMWRGAQYASKYELKPGVSWGAVTPTVVRYLWRNGLELAARDKVDDFHSFVFRLGAVHPVYEVFERGLPGTVAPYAWYLRVPDVVAFVRHIQPALQQRLDGSYMVGHTAELKLSFVRSGLRIAVERGRIRAIEPWQPSPHEASAAFPALTFLPLLFGYRSLDELNYAHRDCSRPSDEVRALLNALFPKQPSDVWPIG